MPVYNGEKYIKEAIDSVLNQTFKDFELLIINDGSTDGSVKIIESYGDPRIRLVHNEKNLGLVETRNRGFAESKAEFIALLDCDDIAYPERLEKQYEFLTAHPGFAMVGSWVELMDSSGKLTGVIWKNTLQPEEISAFLLFKNCFTQSAVMMRASTLPPERYRTAQAEDFDLWIRIARNWKTWNLQHVLVKYRVHRDGISQNKEDVQNQSIDSIAIWQLNNLKINPSPEEVKIHRTNYHYDKKDIIEFINRRENWLKKIKQANFESGYYAEPIFSRVLSRLWLEGCSANSQAGIWILKKFWSSNLSREIKKSDRLAIAKLFIKCLIKK